MATDEYDLREHISKVDLVTGFDGVFDQRQITLYSYATSLPFEGKRIRDALDGAWLGPAMNLGVVQFLSGPEEPEVRVVLGYQAESKVRTFDYERHKAQWWAWRPTIRDTIAIRYSADPGGMLRFTTIGGGLRIKTRRVMEFHSLVLGIPMDASRVLSFDPRVLGKMWMEERFIRRLYSLKARLQDAKRYGSIEHAEFASQRFLDPDCEVLVELRGMADLPVEAFESIVSLFAENLGGELDVRFAIRATSGALRLSLPTFEEEPKFEGDEEQTTTFYNFVEAVAGELVRPEMFLLGQIDPALADPDNPMFPEQIDTVEYREYLRSPETRSRWLNELDTGLGPPRWVPHLHAMDELLAGDIIAAELGPLVAGLARREPRDAITLLDRCRRHGWKRMGALLRDGLVASLPDLPMRAIVPAEEAIIDYGLEHDDAGWDVEPSTRQLRVHGLDFPLASLRPGAASRGLLVVARCLHAELGGSTIDGAVLARLDWALATIPEVGLGGDAEGALALLAGKRVPRTPDEYRAFHPRGPQPTDAPAVDELLLNVHRLPLWPMFEATASAGGWTVKNVGLGHVRRLRVSFDGVDVEGGLVSGGSISGAWPASAPRPSTAELSFEKEGKQRRIVVPFSAPASAAGSLFGGELRATPAAPVGRPRRLDRRQVANRLNGIDKSYLPIGGSVAIQGVIEHILRANIPAAKPAPVLLLGDTGVGKTTLFRLLHATSDRRGKAPEIASGAEGAGGDPSLQRGIWAGYGPGTGLPGIDKRGQPGKFDAAAGSTLFIDECDQLGPLVQADLLLLLEGRPVGRVGKGQSSADVRVVLATNKDPEALVKSGVLRHDLLARIPTANRIVIPPLSARPLDVLPLAREFARRNDVRLTDQVLLALFRRAWPENVRELELFILTAAQEVKLVRRREVTLDDLVIDETIRKEVARITPEDAEREIWSMANELALAEGFAPGHGLQRVAGEIVGVSEGEASKAYERLGWRAA